MASLQGARAPTARSKGVPLGERRRVGWRQQLVRLAKSSQPYSRSQSVFYADRRNSTVTHKLYFVRRIKDPSIFAIFGGIAHRLYFATTFAAVRK